MGKDEHGELAYVSITQALEGIRRDLDDIAARFGKVPSYRKEIDHVLERVATIERHLGINRDIAA